MAETNEKQQNAGVQEPQEGSERHNEEQNQPSKQERDPEVLAKELKKAREEAARYRVERNELREDAEEYRKLKDAEKSELERKDELITELTSKYERAEQARLVADIAVEFGITNDDRILLGQGTEEELRRRAERIAELRENATQATPPSSRPKESMRSGDGGSNEEPDWAYPEGWV